MELQEYNIVDALDALIDYRGRTPKKSEKGIPTLSAKSVKMGYIDYNQCYYISKEEYDSFMVRGFPQKGDILFTTEAPLGVVAKLDRDDVAVAQRLLTLRGKKGVLDNDFLLYYLQSSEGQQRIMAKQSGSTVMGIRQEEFRKINILIPSYEEQKKIASVLSALDDKIALNKKMNQKLEAMAKRLYDYWFVQYDFPDKNGHPYKTTGGKMEYNPTLKREIPVGWEVDNLYAVADYINGLACQNNRPKSGENALPVIKIREMSEGITSDTEEVSENIPSKYIVENGDILFSWSATLLVMIWAGGKGGLNQHIFRVVPKESFPKEFVYQLLSDYVVNFQQIALSRKTTMGHITSDHINLSRVVLPPENVLKRYAEKVRPIFDKIVRNQVEFRKLTALRDKLLPLLMNGQVTLRG